MLGKDSLFNISVFQRKSEIRKMLESLVDGRAFEVSGAAPELNINGQQVAVSFLPVPGQARTYSLLVGEQSFTVEVINHQPEDKTMLVRFRGRLYSLQVLTETDRLLRKLGLNTGVDKKLNELKAPMPGLVLRFLVEEGQEVKKNDPLLVLESMKMENVIKSPGQGVLGKILVSPGQTVEKGDLMLRFNG